jgi:hypothetical protein
MTWVASQDVLATWDVTLLDIQPCPSAIWSILTCSRYSTLQ